MAAAGGLDNRADGVWLWTPGDAVWRASVVPGPRRGARIRRVREGEISWSNADAWKSVVGQALEAAAIELRRGPEASR